MKPGRSSLTMYSIVPASSASTATPKISTSRGARLPNSVPATACSPAAVPAVTRTSV